MAYIQNDHMFLSHYHSPEDGFANLEEGSEWVEDERASISSVVHRSVMKGSLREPVVSKEVCPSSPRTFN